MPRSWAGKRVLLNFGAVDWETTVLINGKEVGRHQGGYTPFKFDITNLLEGGEESIELQVFDPAADKPHAFGMIPKAQAAFQPLGKQLGSVGIWYTRSTGVWQTVWIEPLGEAYIDDYHMIPSLEANSLRIDADVLGQADTFVAKIYRNGILVATQTRTVETNGGRTDKTRIQLDVSLPSVQAWSPEQPNLYDVLLLVKHGKETTDRLRTYCGFRTVSVSGGQIALNGQPYFLRGVLDQGYWPDGIYTAPSEEALNEDLLNAKRMGFNTVRKHAKVEESLFYYLCDRLGLLVAQDMPSSQDLSSLPAKKNFMNEWKEVMFTLWNHPSVAVWIPFNENWGNPGAFQDEVADFTKMADPSRLLIDASGWTQRKKTDIVDHHDYTNDLAQYAKANPAIPQWVGEYGGVALPLDGHTWIKWWGYQSVKTPAKYLQKVKFLTRQMTENQGFSGFCFTQLTDVEQELNGLMTYDRIPKVPLDAVAEIFGS